MRVKLGKGASSDALALILIKLVTICLGFVVTRLMSQYLSTYDYGTYSQIMLVVSTASSLTILGMMDGVNYFYCSEQDEKTREAYVATLFAMQCIVSTAAGILILLFGGVIVTGFDNPDVRRLLVFGAVLPLMQNLLGMLQILMVSVGKARMIAVRNLLVSLFRLAAVLVVVSVLQDVAVILTVTLVLDVVQICLFLWILRKNRCIVRLGAAQFRLSRRILAYCIPMAVFTVINTLNRDCDKYLIALLTDTQTLAIYSNASKVLPFDIIMTSFCTVLLPKITRLVAEKERKKAVVLYRQFLEIAYISTTVLCCAALTAAPQLMQLLYSEKYLSGLTVFCIYILVDMIRFTNITLILSAAGKTSKLMYLGLSAFVGNLVLNVAFFHWIGISGPAIATLVTTAAMGLVMFWMNARELEAGIADFFDIRFLITFSAENLVVMLPLVWVRQWLVRQGMHYFVVLVLICGIYCAGLGMLNGKRLLLALKGVNRK